MTRGANTGRGVHATLGAITLGGLLVLAGPGAAAPRVPGRSPDHYPDAGDVVSAYRTVRAWVDEFDLPAPGEPRAAVTLGNASGVCVILRQSGRVVGTGVDTTGDALMLRRAVGRAMGEVLGDPAVAALPPEAVTRAGLRLSLELEVAGQLIPLLGREFAQIAGQLVPGLDGAAVRRGRNLAMIFPARMRANNTAGRIERLLPALAVEVGLDVMPLPDLVRRFDISLYRFRTIDLAQAAPGKPPFNTVRGDRLVLDEQVTRDAIEDLAQGIVEHLAAAMAPDTIKEVGLMGTYHPAADRYRPLIAPPVEQALAAWALSRYGRVPGLDALTATRVADLSGRILDDLGHVGGGEIDPLSSSVACSAIVHAALEHRSYLDARETPRLFLEAARRARSAWTPQDGFIDVDERTVVPPHARAMIASAMTKLLAADRTSIDAATVRQAIDAAWSSVPPHRHVSLMPWIGWAEADYAAATGQPLRAGPLRAVRDLLDAGQLGRATVPDEADLAGGFALSRHRQPGPPTSQTLRPAALLAWMIRDTALTSPAEAPGALRRSLATMRFIMQLAVRDSLVWACPDQRRALGGIRTATWDWDQPVPVQALALATAAETLWSLDAVSGGDPLPGTPTRAGRLTP